MRGTIAARVPHHYGPGQLFFFSGLGHLTVPFARLRGRLSAKWSYYREIPLKGVVILPHWQDELLSEIPGGGVLSECEYRRRRAGSTGSDLQTPGYPAHCRRVEIRAISTLSVKLFETRLEASH